MKKLDPAVVNRYVARYPHLSHMAKMALSYPAIAGKFVDAACRLEAPPDVSIRDIHEMSKI